MLEGGRFHIPSVAQAVADCLRRDGIVFGARKVEQLIHDAMRDMGYPAVEAHAGPCVMSSILSEWTDRLGVALGRQVTDEGFMLDWGPDCKHLERLCMDIAQFGVQAFAVFSDIYEEKHGYGFGQVFMRMMEQGVSADEAAGQIELELGSPGGLDS